MKSSVRTATDIKTAEGRCGGGNFYFRPALMEMPTRMSAAIYCPPRPGISGFERNRRQPQV